MPADRGRVTRLSFAWMSADAVHILLKPHAPFKLIADYVRAALIGLKLNWASVQERKTGGLLVISGIAAAGFLISDCRAHFCGNSGLMLFFFSFFFFTATEDAFHVGSQPQEKTTHTPLPLTGWVILLGQNGCGGWEEAHHWLPPARGGGGVGGGPACCLSPLHVGRWMSVGPRKKGKKTRDLSQGMLSIRTACVYQIWPRQVMMLTYSKLDLWWGFSANMLALSLPSFPNREIMSGWGSGRCWS